MAPTTTSRISTPLSEMEPLPKAFLMVHLAPRAFHSRISGCPTNEGIRGESGDRRNSLLFFSSSLGLLSLSTPPKPERQRDQRYARAGGIQQRIINGRAPAGHEGLVEFIAGGIDCGNQQRDASPAPPPPAVAASHCAVEQKEIHKVFPKMRALADEVMDVVVLALRQPWNQPAQNWLKKPFRVFRGKSVRGHGENHARPHNRRPPRPKPRNPSRRRSLGTNFRQGWCGTRIAPRLGVH